MNSWRGKNANTDKVAISASTQDTSVHYMWYLCEKGGRELDFVAPNPLLIDHKKYVNAEHVWKEFLVRFVNENEFYIENYQWECINYFTRWDRRKH